MPELPMIADSKKFTAFIFVCILIVVFAVIAILMGVDKATVFEKTLTAVVSLAVGYILGQGVVDTFKKPEPPKDKPA